MRLVEAADLAYRVFITVVKELHIWFYLLYSLLPKSNKPICKSFLDSMLFIGKLGHNRYQYYINTFYIYKKLT